MKIWTEGSRFVVLLLCMALLPSASHAGDPDSGIKHVVFCWLHEPGRTDQVQRIINSSRELKSIPGVMDIRAGTALPSERPIVDDSFDVGITMTFSDKTALDNYLTHPEHLSRVNRVFRPLCERILVYDIVY